MNLKTLLPLILLVAFFVAVYFDNTSSVTDVVRGNKTILVQEELPQIAVRVIDGDTFVLANGRVVRLIGINTPEYGEPYYEEATNKLT